MPKMKRYEYDDRNQDELREWKSKRKTKKYDYEENWRFDPNEYEDEEPLDFNDKK